MGAVKKKKRLERKQRRLGGLLCKNGVIKAFRLCQYLEEVKKKAFK